MAEVELSPEMRIDGAENHLKIEPEATTLHNPNPIIQQHKPSFRRNHEFGSGNRHGNNLGLDLNDIVQNMKPEAAEFIKQEP